MCRMPFGWKSSNNGVNKISDSTVILNNVDSDLTVHTCFIIEAISQTYAVPPGTKRLKLKDKVCACSMLL